jgi:hypothetical protein
LRVTSTPPAVSTQGAGPLRWPLLFYEWSAKAGALIMYQKHAEKNSVHDQNHAASVLRVILKITPHFFNVLNDKPKQCKISEHRLAGNTQRTSS